MRLLGQLVDDGQVAFVVADMTQFGNEVVGDVVDWSNETTHFRLADQSLAELCPVLVPVAPLPATVRHTSDIIRVNTRSSVSSFDYQVAYVINEKKKHFIVRFWKIGLKKLV